MEDDERVSKKEKEIKAKQEAACKELMELGLLFFENDQNEKALKCFRSIWDMVGRDVSSQEACLYITFIHLTTDLSLMENPDEIILAIRDSAITGQMRKFLRGIAYVMIALKLSRGESLQNAKDAEHYLVESMSHFKLFLKQFHMDEDPKNLLKVI